MEIKTLYISAILLLLIAASCGGESVTKTTGELPTEQIAVFTSTDRQLQKSYEWARKTALSYSHDGSDPVGYWYEAALPNREAFCMRDVSHQSVGAQILGLVPHNKNMFTLFAENISEQKDWCSYWEINRYNKPAPADYLNDKEFWYNLNANFDVMQACLKMYRWTGDNEYVSGEKFIDFFEKNVTEYIDRWNLSPDSIMSRQPYMNVPDGFDSSNNFHTCRGLPSYVENIPGVAVGIDLLASLYAGFNSYSVMAYMNENPDASGSAEKKAMEYRDIIENEWWDAENQSYHTMMLPGGEFRRGEGLPYILWFDVSDNADRIKIVLDDITKGKWNVENISHFPELFYRYGYSEEAYRYLVSLPSMSRSEYPEVSYGFIEGCVCGAMGFRPDYADKSVATVSRLMGSETDSQIRNIKVFDGYMTLRHVGNDYSELTNDTSEDLVWKASFLGDYSIVEAGGISYPVVKTTDLKGNIFSTAEISLASKTALVARAVADSSRD